MAIAAASAGHFLPDNTEEPLLRHFGVNARFLVAIPLLIFGEPVLQTLTRDVILQFVRNGLVTDKDRARFAALVESTLRWVHRWPPWVVIAGLATAWVTLTPASWSAHDLLWAGDDPTGRPDLRSRRGGTPSWRVRSSTRSSCRLSRPLPSPSPRCSRPTGATTPSTTASPWRGIDGRPWRSRSSPPSTAAGFSARRSATKPSSPPPSWGPRLTACCSTKHLVDALKIVVSTLL